MTKEEFLKELNDELEYMTEAEGELPKYMQFIIHEGINGRYDCDELISPEVLFSLAKKCIEDKECFKELDESKDSVEAIGEKYLRGVFNSRIIDTRKTVTLQDFYKLLLTQKIRSEIIFSKTFLKQFFILSIADFINLTDADVNIDFEEMLDDIKDMSNYDCRNIHFDDFIDEHLINEKMKKTVEEPKGDYDGDLIPKRIFVVTDDMQRIQQMNGKKEVSKEITEIFTDEQIETLKKIAKMFNYV